MDGKKQENLNLRETREREKIAALEESVQIRLNAANSAGAETETHEKLVREALKIVVNYFIEQQITRATDFQYARFLENWESSYVPRANGIPRRANFSETPSEMSDFASPERAIKD